MATLVFKADNGPVVCPWERRGKTRQEYRKEEDKEDVEEGEGLGLAALHFRLM